MYDTNPLPSCSSCLPAVGRVCSICSCRIMVFCPNDTADMAVNSVTKIPKNETGTFSRYSPPYKHQLQSFTNAKKDGSLGGTGMLPPRNRLRFYRYIYEIETTLAVHAIPCLLYRILFHKPPEPYV